MDAIKNLKKIAASEFGFDKLANKNSFNLSGDDDCFWIYRVRNSLVDTMEFWPCFDNTAFNITTVVWSPEILGDYDLSKMPEGFNMSERGLPTKYWLTREDGVTDYDDFWDIDDEDTARESLKEVIPLIEKHVFHWFNSIKTKKQVYDTLSASVKDIGKLWQGPIPK